MFIAEALTFHNEPLADFSKPESREEMTRALSRVKDQIGRSHPLVIGGKPVRVSRTLRSINPSDSRQIIGIVADASRQHADLALAAAGKAFESWSAVPVEKRAALLKRTASLLRQRKMEFCAWLILEVGKNWAEADADVAEAIDFLDYYAELSLQPVPMLTPVRGERNEYRYLPLGVVVVIPPWNFPLAILVGMTMAAVVSGNTVVLKPSSQSPVIAEKFMELVQEAGLPAGVINLITGRGAAIGDFLVKDPRARMVAFTGSREVGLHINALAAQPSKGQIWIKRVIAEMGGKNAIIVDKSADVEAAVQGVLVSAFGYQGQKCSACSRAYIHEKIYPEFVVRLIEKTRQIRQGPAEDPENFMGPVISAESKRKIERYVAWGMKEGRLLSPRPLGGEGWGEEDRGFFVPPAIFDRLPPSSRLFSEEIFGPVLALAKIKTFEEGLDLANRSDYGLTGAVFSADPAHLDLARHDFFCGNLYLNRKCTGAWVGGHPFGGFNMSGTDSKAGGPEYLMLFQQAKAISEKV